MNVDTRSQHEKQLQSVFVFNSSQVDSTKIRSPSLLPESQGSISQESQGSFHRKARFPEKIVHKNERKSPLQTLHKKDSSTLSTATVNKPQHLRKDVLTFQSDQGTHDLWINSNEISLEINKGIKTMRCCHCSKLFASESNAINHIMAVHRKNRLFLCTICNKLADNRQSLSKRIAMVHGGKSTNKVTPEQNISTPEFVTSSHIFA